MVSVNEEQVYLRAHNSRLKLGTLSKIRSIDGE